ncbi:MAG: aldose 1-epimerase family protein [Oscillospiraceae bacterium]|nr:aldose 1-epimerase family protein [Oscillospiraceae bacterium]
MLYHIRNEHLQVSVSAAGAELMSIKGVDGTEYLWQGDSAYWSDRAPNIFPYVARLTKGSYTYQGKTYHLPIHGFAPTALFTVTEESADAVTFSLESCPEFYEMYPFNFRFSIRYHLEGSTLHVELKVENLDNKAMFFGLGGHPGINAPLEEGLGFEDYYLQFPPCSPRRVEFTPACFITGREDPFPLENGKLPLHHDMFNDDAIVLKGMADRVTLRSDKGQRAVTLIAPDLPVYGFWHMPKTDAPYICLEPWSSLPSRQDVVEDLETQPDLIRLEAGKTYMTTWSLQCL